MRCCRQTLNLAFIPRNIHLFGKQLIISRHSCLNTVLPTWKTEYLHYRPSCCQWTQTGNQNKIYFYSTTNEDASIGMPLHHRVPTVRADLYKHSITAFNMAYPCILCRSCWTTRDFLRQSAQKLLGISINSGDGSCMSSLSQPTLYTSYWQFFKEQTAPY